MPDYEVRPATLRDAKAIAEVHVASARAAYAGILPEDQLSALAPSTREAKWREAHGVESTPDPPGVPAGAGGGTVDPSPAQFAAMSLPELMRMEEERPGITDRILREHDHPSKLYGDAVE